MRYDGGNAVCFRWVDVFMTRLLVLFAIIALGRPCTADETAVKYAAIASTLIKTIRGVEIGPTSGEVVRLPWSRPDVEVIATKVATDRAGLDAIRVNVSMDGDRLSIRVGEHAGQSWIPLRAGSKVNLTIRLPERLMDRSQPLDHSGTSALVATADIH
jgi:hypothetical protein